MGALLTALGGWLLRVLLVSLIAGLASMFGDAILTGVGKVLDLFVGTVNSTSLTSLPTVSDSIGALPPEVLSIMKRVQLDTCLSIIGTAYSIRFAGNVFGVLRGMKGSS